MKKILGLDLGVSSVGVALLLESDNQKKIEKLAVRIVPEDPNFHGKFYSGNTASKNAERTIARGIRRSNQRFKLRRDALIDLLKQKQMYPDQLLLHLPVLDLYALRARAIKEKVSLQELGRIFLHLIQRRGFLSNRRNQSEEEKTTEYKDRINQLEKNLQEKTIGTALYEELRNQQYLNSIELRGRTYLRKTYKEEFDRIWKKQKEYYPELLTGGEGEQLRNTLYNKIGNKIIFYQRPLKSQKALVSDCAFEKHHKAINKSSPFFEIFRIWQRINDLEVTSSTGNLKWKPSLEQKQKLFESLFYGKDLNRSYKLSGTKIKKILGIRPGDGYLNFTELEGSRTYSILRKVLEEAEIEKPDSYLFFNPQQKDEKGGLFELWHITYSLPTEEEVINTLVKRFNFTEEQAYSIAQKVGYSADYGNLSTRAIKKLLPYMQQGVNYYEACEKVGYDHSGYKTEKKIADKLPVLRPNSLRNPVVEQILNQVINVVNNIVDQYGAFEGEDEIRIEFSRELKNNAKARKRISQEIERNTKENRKIKNILEKEYGYKYVSNRDVQRYKLWEETNRQCIYSGKPITMNDLLKGLVEIEHILPKSRSFSNNMNNFILVHKKINEEKGAMTAYDFMQNRGEVEFQRYLRTVHDLYAEGKGKINKAKFENLLCKGEDISSDVVERMQKDTQYIVKETKKMLETIAPKVSTTTGQITDFLREKWGIKNLLQEMALPVYKELGKVETKQYKDKEGNLKEYEVPLGWSKRDDHRHHAIDALICALTDQKIIFALNNLNKIYQEEKGRLSSEERQELEEFIGDRFNLKSFSDLAGRVFDPPLENMRKELKKHIQDIFVSFKKSSKVLSRNTNKLKNGKFQQTWTPRGRLHEETIMSVVKLIADKKEKINSKFNKLEEVVIPSIKKLLTEYISQHGGTPEKAFSSKNLKAHPLLYKGKKVEEVAVYEEVKAKRVPLVGITNAEINKIIDSRIQKLVKNRLLEHKGNIKEAFAEPLWLNKEKEIQIKSVTVKDNSKVISVRKGYAKTGGNHHALVYKDEKGNYTEKLVSFYEAVAMGLHNIDVNNGKLVSVIDRSHREELGLFQFSLQINDLFVFDFKHSHHPQEENEIDFFDPKNRALISKKLFRVQKMSKGSTGQFLIEFRHHLETKLNREISEVTFIRISSNKNLERLTKIHINHLGEIIKVGDNEHASTHLVTPKIETVC